MATHFAILPEGIIQTLSAQLDSQTIDGIQFLSLPHPRTGLLALFLPSPYGILELQAVSPTDGRSWFLGDEIVEDGKLVVMTPIDPTFLILPLLQAAQVAELRTADDVFEEIIKKLLVPCESKDRSLLERSLNTLSTLSCTQQSLRCICDVKDFGPDTTVYRYSEEKTKQYLMTKVGRLESSKSFDVSRTIIRNLAKDGLMEDGKDNLLAVGRTKAAVDLVSQYLSPENKQVLLSAYDFSELQTYLKGLFEEHVPLKSATNKKKATAAETDKKRKADKTSHGVAQLKKANTTGMAKLSNFFTKVEKAS